MPASASSSSKGKAPRGSTSPRSPSSASTISPSRSVSHRTSSKFATYNPYQDENAEPPRTPPNNSKSRRRLSTKAAPQESTSHLRVNPRTGPEIEENRLSHGLSWASSTRDSVVDNMLLSLDSMGDASVPEREIPRAPDFDVEKFRMPEIPFWQQYTAPTKPPTRPRGHTYSSSLSTEYNPRRNQESGAESPASFKTASTTRGRRSVSGSGMGIVVDSAAADKRISTDTQKYMPAMITSREPFPEVAAAPDPIRESPAAKRAWKRRSVSVDQLYFEANNASSSSMLNRGRPVPSLLSAYEGALDSAPEPSVAGGPRSKLNPSSGPAYIGPAPKRNSVRKVTTQGDLRGANKSILAPPTPSIPQNVRDQANEFVRSSSIRMPQSPNAPTSPAIRTGSTNKSQTQKERPGFFKRVFGARSNNAPTPERAESRANTSTDTTERPTPQTPKKAQASSGRASEAAPSVKENSRPPTAQTTTSLNKKSSFFRRRKKSEVVDVPPLPDLSAHPMVQAAEPSPSISSLRKVMDPFLASGDPSAATRDAPGTSHSATDSEDLALFHSGYKPAADPVVGDISAGMLQSIEAGTDITPQPKLKVKKRPDMSLPIQSNREPSHGASLTAEGAGSTLSAKFSSESFLKSPSPPISPISPVSGKTATSSDYRGTRNFSGETNNGSTIDDESFVIRQGPKSPTLTSRSDRLYLSPHESDDARHSSFDSNSFHTASQRGRSSKTVSAEPRGASVTSLVGQLKPSVEVAAPAEMDGAEYYVRARKIFDGDEEDVCRADAAAWLGERNNLSTRTLEAYMQLFDFSGLNVLSALRALCSKLLLRGETQQFDRIIQALSRRWYQCNPNNGFKAEDVIHTVCYSLILLNTDLHLADIGEKMSRTAYVKNTLPTIRRVVTDAAPNAFDDTIKAAPSSRRPSIPWMDSSNSITTTPPISPMEGADGAASGTTSSRASIRPGIPRSDSDAWTPDTTSTATNALVNAPWQGNVRGWEVEIEMILKSFYNSIRSDPLPLIALDRNLSVNGPTLAPKRSGSIMSRTPSEAQSQRAKNPSSLKSMTMAWQSRNGRNRPKIYPNSTYGSSQTSFDDSNSIWSPAQSSNWSKNSFGKTLTSPSMGSLQSSGDAFKHSIGFAHALSQAIIREENPGSAGADSESFNLPGGLLDDEALALEGAPWAKEGLVKHKHHLEGPNQKAKERNWNDCFAVISKGRLRLFNFNTSSKSQSMGRKAGNKASGRAASVTAPRVGGGDWMENAEQLGSFVLRHVIASTLPPPGYSKTRPHVWALSFPTGAVHLFSVGTPEIAKEFMTTANYWSARLSKEPLSGGVSNIEYGWSDGVLNMAAFDRSESVVSPPPSIQNMGRSHIRSPSSSGSQIGRTSLQSSLRTSLDQGFGGKARLPGDRIHIADWQPPSQSMMASQLLEVDQLRQLTAYVKSMESELAQHNEMKHGIDLAFTPRHTNYSRAMNNWQRKSDYLLREIVKFQTYVDSLNAAQSSREDYNKRKAEMDAVRWKALGAAAISSTNA